MIDKACLLWQDLCGQNGFCLVYQNAAMSRYLLSAGLVYKVSWGGVGAGLSSPRWGPAASARGPRPGALLPQRFVPVHVRCCGWDCGDTVAGEGTVG